VHKLELKATFSNNRHKLDWEIVADENVVEQVVEVATDGARFQPLTAVAASARSFGYQPEKAAVLYYRLNVTFDDGRKYHSNITALHSNGASGKPYLVSNVVAGHLSINSPSGYLYTIYDLSGRQLAKGQLLQGMNAIPAGFMAKGLYILHFTNNQQQYTEKFMKQ
jgi:hypothetical protein